MTRNSHILEVKVDSLWKSNYEILLSCVIFVISMSIDSEMVEHFFIILDIK